MASNSTRWFWGIVAGVIFIGMLFVGLSFLFLASVIKSGSGDYYSSGSGGKIAVVEVNDVIIFSESTVEQIKKYREDKSIKAIIVHVNSPGGGVAASQEIYDEIRKTRESGKPIVVSMASLAASGGYYISCGANLIVANPGTLTGSIGVIISILNFKDLAEKWGIKENIIKSGELKDAGNPFRDMNDKDREYFQNVVDNTFDQFLDVVSKERKIDREKLKEYANGRVFTGVQAQKLGLIDSLGTFEDAIRITARLAGIEGEPRIIREKKKFSIVERLLGSKIEDITLIKQRLFEEPILQYKFIP